MPGCASATGRRLGPGRSCGAPGTCSPGLRHRGAVIQEHHLVHRRMQAVPGPLEGRGGCGGAGGGVWKQRARKWASSQCLHLSFTVAAAKR